MKKKEDLSYQLYVQRENEFFHEPYKNELFIYEAVKRGDTDLILENQRKYSNSANSGKGNLSKDPLCNQKYHMIINTALITRICAESGLPHETAYTLSDMFIRRVDNCKSVREVMALNDEMVLEFTSQMKTFLKKDILSVSIRKTLDYICDNLHRKITVEELAENVNLNRSYLSVLFKKEIGKSIQNYVLEKRLETAENMLIHSEFSCSEISQALYFSSQSYFIKRFKEKNGITPKEYREKKSAIIR